MNFKKIKLAIGVAMLCLVLISISYSVFAADNNINQPKRKPFEYRLMVPLPTHEGTVTSTKGIVNYIRTLYLFGLGIAGVLAMGMIVVAGFMWVTATGNTGTIGKSKERITNAILGLVLLMAAYLILNTINPALVNLKEPYIYFINWGEKFGGEKDAGGGGTPPPPPPRPYPDDCYADATSDTKIVNSCSAYPHVDMGSGPSNCLNNVCGATKTGSSDVDRCWISVGVSMTCMSCQGINSINDYNGNGTSAWNQAPDPCGVGSGP